MNYLKKRAISAIVVIAITAGGLLSLTTTAESQNPAADVSSDAMISQAVLQGTVTDANTDSPLPGVKVEISAIDKSATTGDDGTYKFSDLRLGKYEVTISHEGYQDFSKTVTITGQEPKNIDIELKPKQ